MKKLEKDISKAKGRKRERRSESRKRNVAACLPKAFVS